MTAFFIRGRMSILARQNYHIETQRMSRLLIEGTLVYLKIDELIQDFY